MLLDRRASHYFGYFAQKSRRNQLPPLQLLQKTFLHRRRQIAPISELDLRPPTSLAGPGAPLQPSLPLQGGRFQLILRKKAKIQTEQSLRNIPPFRIRNRSCEHPKDGLLRSSPGPAQLQNLQKQKPSKLPQSKLHPLRGRDPIDHVKIPA